MSLVPDEATIQDAVQALSSALQDEIRDGDLMNTALTKCRENMEREYAGILQRRRRTAYDRAEHRSGPDRVTVWHRRDRPFVFAELTRNGSYSAPTVSQRPIATGTVSQLEPFGDMIVRLLDERRAIMYNVTLPNHMFFPGYVKLAVMEYGDSTIVEASGYGRGSLATFNQVGGPLLFRGLLMRFASRLRRR